MARHKLTPEECRRGGKARAQQESFKDACRAGFQATLERHPFYARHWLKQKIKASAEAKTKEH
jgi:hypothetical protein